MRHDRYTDDDIRQALLDALKDTTVRELARRIEVSRTFVSIVSHGKCAPGPKVAAYFGFVEDNKRWIRQSPRRRVTA